MHLSTPSPRHHAVPLPRRRRSSPLVARDGLSDNLSGVFLGPGGQIITSNDGVPSMQSQAQQGGDADPVPGGSPQDAGTASAAAGPSTVDVKQVMTSSLAASQVSSPPVPTSTGSPTTVEAQSTDPVSIGQSATSTDTLAPSTTTSGLSGTVSSSQATSTDLPPPSAASSAVEPTSTEATATATATATPPPMVNSASTSAAANHGTSFYIGIAFAAIAGAGLIVAILAWWLRIRSQSRRRQLNRMTSWPWDTDRLSTRQPSLEGGLGIGIFGAGRGEMAQHSHIHSPLPADILANSGALNSVPYPMSPAPAHVHMQGGSPYVTVPLHGGAHQSVPDLAPALGTLQITNLTPGDLSCGGSQSSRASTALGVLHTYPAEYGTPFMPHRPCFLGVKSGGLDVPWAPLRVRRAGSSAVGAPGEKYEGGADMDEEKFDEVPLPYPGDIAVPADAPHPPLSSGGGPDGWAASIRSNILNAFNAVVGTGPAQKSIASLDGFTRSPHRSIQRIRRPIPHGPRDSAHDADEPHAEWTLDDNGGGAGMAHIHDESDLAQDPFADDLQIPPPAAVGACDRQSGLLPVPPQASVTRASSMYSTDSGFDDQVDADDTGRICDAPPQLPTISTLSRSPSAQSDPEGAPPPLGRTQGRKRTARKQQQQRRPTLSARQSSSQRSATSVGSEMSRACSEERLTDGERFAQDALRERRRRMKDMHAHIPVGRAKTRRARATTLSRRRSNERTAKMRRE